MHQLNSLISTLLLIFFFNNHVTASEIKQKSAKDPRIVGGFQVSNVDDWPWMVGILKADVSNNFQAQFCGGSLIAPQWVITGAHCFFDPDTGVQDIFPNNIDILLGQHQLSANNGERIRVTELIIHPLFDLTEVDSDLALLKLSRSSSRTPINMVTANDAALFAPGVDMVTIGWGLTNDSDKTSKVDNLREVSVPIVSNAICELGFDTNQGPLDWLTNNMFCGGLPFGGKDSCQGDSGGPVMVINENKTAWILAGITSWGLGCGVAGQYGVYTRLSNFENFVRSTIASKSTTAFLESPQQNTLESGVGLVRGWACNATEIVIQVDSFPPFNAGYGTSRNDTLSICGDSNNGFGATTNWNLFGSGRHVIRAFVDGSLFADASFEVGTLGGEFLTGVSQSYTLFDFPQPGTTQTITWSTAAQNFVFSTGTAASGSNPTGDSTHSLESPQLNSFESGIGLIRGWACDANRIEIQIDNNAREEAAYGTPRGDTQSVCNDTNNGFGVTTNWNLFGDGQHTLRAFADGVQFSEVTFNVTTLGVEFLRGISQDFDLPNFPVNNQTTAIRWSEPQQNFVIRGIR